jgi:diacylglycerol kinase (ATP)
MAFFDERCRSFKYAFKGIFYAFGTQSNLWIHALAALVVVAGGYFLRITTGEWLFIVAAIGAVISAEIFNTSIEKLVDIVSPEKQEKAGIVKDLAAGAVFIASLMALIIGCIIFIPKILQVIFTGSV